MQNRLKVYYVMTSYSFIFPNVIV